MSSLLRTTFALSVGIALLVPAPAGAQEPPPEDLPPPPPTQTQTQPEDPVVEIEAPPTVTIQVPPLPEPTPTPKPAPQEVTVPRSEPARPEPARRASPTPSVREYEPVVTESPEIEAPVAEPAPVSVASAKPKPNRKKVQRAKPRVVAKATAPPVRTIRDPDRAGAVLAAQFTLRGEAEANGIDTSVILLAIALAAWLGSVVGVIGAAPLLAERWPSVFVPVIDATERIMLAGVCLAGAALTVAITWALAARAG